MWNSSMYSSQPYANISPAAASPAAVIASPAGRMCGAATVGVDHDGKWTPTFSPYAADSGSASASSKECCPQRMNGSRAMTDYRTKCKKLFEGVPNADATTMTSFEYRKYLTEQAATIMEQNRVDAEKKLNPCGLVNGPSTKSAADLGGNGGFDGGMFASIQEAYGTA